MKTFRIFTCAIALGAATLLTSCVDPYYSGGTTTTTITHYRPGYVVDTLPRGHRTEIIGGVNYYRYNDVYYRPQGRRYVVVERPRGYDRNDHRDRYDRKDPRDRYDHGRDSRDPRDFRPGGPRRPDTVMRTLPRGARVVNHRGVNYYESGGTYYRPGNGGYVVVARPF